MLNRERLHEIVRDLSEEENSNTGLAAMVGHDEVLEMAQLMLNLDWQPITPETKFDRSLDYMLGRPLRGSTIIRGDDFQRDGAGKHLRKIGWTHFRPINPPKEAQ